eukprot:m.67899 g.67899  ORF g.67899 m.67899 type:complete len:1053 (-) comp12180_c0_seq1:499-3657(-)
MGGENVQVAVRVRPFNDREKQRKAVLCIKMEGKQTTIFRQHEGKKEERKFTFDYSYWSHDGYKETPEQLLVPVGANYADQAKVFDDLGVGVLNNAFEGYNASLFAYGQTGSGKSYSMVGYGPNKGIVPITCEQLFERMRESQASAVNPTRYRVLFSMLEIYNEHIHDLLATVTKGGHQNLKLRENTKLGKFVVQNLKEVLVESYKDIEAQIARGTKNRTVAATQMNSTSSRAHTIVTISFEQISKNAAGDETTKRSEINLVDLAGSERAESTGAEGARLKEGANINKSLSALGNVIAALAKKAASKKGDVFVPYNNSVLTRLLKNALGGNSKTVMVAALSPADINYEETLSTLRFADRAKQIKNAAVVNESPTDRLIRELKEQVAALTARLGPGGAIAAPGMLDDKLQQQLEEEHQRRLELERMLQFQEDTKPVDSGVDSSSDAEDVELESQRASTIPHLTNMNEDPALNNVINHFLEASACTLGQGESEEGVDIQVHGFNIRKKHALIRNENGTFMIEPASPTAQIRVNAQPVTAPQELKHHDRVIFGSNNVFLFVNPVDMTVRDGTPDKVTWSFVQEELMAAAGVVSGADQATLDELLEVLPMIAEVNAISEEMNKHMQFDITMGGAVNFLDGTTAPRVQVKATDIDSTNEWILERVTFVDMRYQIQDMYQEWALGKDHKESALFGPPVREDDPFYLAPSEFHVGQGTQLLKLLTHGLGFEETVVLLDAAGRECGSAQVGFQPCTADGTPFEDQDIFFDDPTAEFFGYTDYKVKVTVYQATISLVKYAAAAKIVVRFGNFGELMTPWVEKSSNPVFNYTAMFTVPKIDEQVFKWMEEGVASVHLYSRHVASERSVESTAAVISKLEHELTALKSQLIDRDSDIRRLSMDLQSQSKASAASAVDSSTSSRRGTTPKTSQKERELQARLTETQDQLARVQKESQRQQAEQSARIKKLEEQLSTSQQREHQSAALTRRKSFAADDKLKKVLQKHFMQQTDNAQFHKLWSEIAEAIQYPDTMTLATPAGGSQASTTKTPIPAGQPQTSSACAIM